MEHMVFTDLHVDLNISNPRWERLPIDAVNHLTTTARRRGIKSILFLGDFYNNRKEISVPGIDSARIICEILNDFDTHIICGNHDSYFKNTTDLSSLQTLERYNNIHTILKPTVVHDKIGLCPWGGDFRQLNTKILMGHFDIKDFKMNDNAISLKGEPISSFKNYDLVLSGHYHTYSKKDNIIYIGNMYGHTFNDLDATRGYWIFNDESYEMEFIEFTDAPKFIYVHDMDFDKTKITGNNVKIFLSKEYPESEVNDFLLKIKSLDPLELDVDYRNLVIEDVENPQSDLSGYTTLDERQLFDSYLEKITLPDHIKIDTCKKILLDLFQTP